MFALVRRGGMWISSVRETHVKLRTHTRQPLELSCDNLYQSLDFLGSRRHAESKHQPGRDS